MTPSGLVHVVVVHAQGPQCDGLCDAITDSGGYRVVGSPHNCAEALALMRTVAADVLVMDLASVGAEASGMLSAARALAPRVGILLVSRGHARSAVQDLLARGATGCVDYAAIGEQLAPALRTIGMGRRYLPAVEAGS